MILQTDRKKEASALVEIVVAVSVFLILMYIIADFKKPYAFDEKYIFTSLSCDIKNCMSREVSGDKGHIIYIEENGYRVVKSSPEGEYTLRRFTLPSGYRFLEDNNNKLKFIDKTGRVTVQYPCIIEIMSRGKASFSVKITTYGQCVCYRRK